MQDGDKIERLKEQVHRLSVAKAELEDEVAILRHDAANRATQLKTLISLSLQYGKAAGELVGADH